MKVDEELKVDLITAVKRGDVEKLREKLKIAPHLIDVKTSSGYTLLCWAAYAGLFEVVKVLLEAGADKTKPTTDGRTPLELAKKEMLEARPQREILSNLPMVSRETYGRIIDLLKGNK